MIQGFKQQIQLLQQQQSPQKVQQLLQHQQKDIERLQQLLVAQQQRLQSEEEAHESATAALAAALQEKEASAAAAAEAAAAALRDIGDEKDALALELRMVTAASAAAAADAAVSYSAAQMLNQQQRQQLDEQLRSLRDEVERLRLQLSEEQQRLHGVEQERDGLVLQLQETKGTSTEELEDSYSYGERKNDMRQHMQQLLLLPCEENESKSHSDAVSSIKTSRSMSKTLQRAFFFLAYETLVCKLSFSIVLIVTRLMQLSLRCAEVNRLKSGCTLRRGR